MARNGSPGATGCLIILLSFFGGGLVTMLIGASGYMRMFPHVANVDAPPIVIAIATILFFLVGLATIIGIVIGFLLMVGG